MQKQLVKKLSLDGDIDQRVLFGQNGAFLRIIEEAFGIKIIARGETVTLEGAEKDVKQVETVIHDLISHLRNSNELTERYVLYSIGMVKQNGVGPAKEIESAALITSIVTKESIKPRTVGQKEYVKAMEANDIVIVIGPAGTGKTYLAVATAVAALKQKKVNRIILCRPAVEAGESLGFLPGDIRAKVDPYLRPVYDALHEMLPSDKIQKLMELGTIEIVPLAFMRGRTLNSSYIILDEAQNATLAQMKMFLTRAGENSKVIITGDITQIDLTDKKSSGLILCQKILEKVRGIEFVYLTEKDVVRHRLVAEIIKAFERYEKGS